MTQKTPVHVVGAGLAGSEAAWVLAEAQIPVILYEMRPKHMTPAHKTSAFAELVCSNSFRSDDALHNAVGILHEEMRLANSLIMRCADKNQVPAGSALAVDREGFSQAVTEKLRNHPYISIKCQEITKLPAEAEEQEVIIATGPLTSPGLAEEIQNFAGKNTLSFFDAIAPIIYKDSVNMDICWFQSRYDKIGPHGTTKDYLNCPLNKTQYEDFVHALLNAEQVDFHSFEKETYFDGCLPIEVMAKRGIETLRHGPMKPMGLTNAHKPTEKPYAVVQLRQDNALGTLYNMVGFQTKLRYSEQTRIFRTIPGLEEAQFARLGGIHKNTYLNSPLLLTSQLQLKGHPHLRFAGQITGCEGYVESAAIGLLAGLFTAAQYNKKVLVPPPPSTAFGALLNHITAGHLPHIEETGKGSFQPMNINFGLFAPIEKQTDSLEDGTKPSTPLKGKERTRVKREQISRRALETWKTWLAEAAAIVHNTNV